MQLKTPFDLQHTAEGSHDHVPIPDHRGTQPASACPADDRRITERPCRTDGFGKPQQNSHAQAPTMSPAKNITAKSKTICRGSACTRGQAGQENAGHWQGSHSNSGQSATGQCRGSGAESDQNVFSDKTIEATTPAIRAVCGMYEIGAHSYFKKA